MGEQTHCKGKNREKQKSRGIFELNNHETLNYTTLAI